MVATQLYLYYDLGGFWRGEKLKTWKSSSMFIQIVVALDQDLVL